MDQYKRDTGKFLLLNAHAPTSHDSFHLPPASIEPPPPYHLHLYLSGLFLFQIQCIRPYCLQLNCSGTFLVAHGGGYNSMFPYRKPINKLIVCGYLSQHKWLRRTVDTINIFLKFQWLINLVFNYFIIFHDLCYRLKLEGCLNLFTTLWENSISNEKEN